ncbi:MAG: cobalamin biosynthesis protein CobW [Rickettsiales bacterium]|nr:cobalamin biosynthesis protein CobW [Rickettsiales bacterium]OUV52794.1 MAG: cobalamin biosynthesis protein CobW [Rickettsiales bacterium TMED127]|tara:strand:- start:14882 stop:16234 length:1353 start_codon:yes stop_codon:yes gene_type:complete
MNNSSTKIPVTILTGFLGSGKTTLLNRILSEKHGKRIAVIENEYGEVGIDQALVINAEEEIFEMANGCICCTVRGDLIRVLGNLMKRRDKFDYVIVETTGLADPGPVAQTFFMDDEISSEFALDGIITLVDTYHIKQQLGRSDESTEQIAFADVVVLNKTDLVINDEVDKLEVRLREMNKMAKFIRSEMANVPINSVLDKSAFNLDQVLKRRPTFLEPEYPFEWTGVYKTLPGKYKLVLSEGPDPTMSLVIGIEQGNHDADLRNSAEQCVRLYAEEPEIINPEEIIPKGKHVNLKLELPGQKVFYIDIEKEMHIGLFAQHTAEEFDMKLIQAENNAEIPVVEQRTWIAQHEHDDEVGSISIEKDGDLDQNKLQAWLSKLLGEKGIDIFRMKGFLSIAGESDRFVFQGVHMLFDGKPDRPWGSLPRKNQLVFIGRNLNKEEMVKGFEDCLV